MNHAPPIAAFSHPHLRDLLGVALYGVGLVLIAVAFYAGLRAVASDISNGAVVAAHAVDSWSQSEEDSARTPSNFEQWLALRDTIGAFRHVRVAEHGEVAGVLEHVLLHP